MERLRDYEDREILPLVQQVGAAPVRDDVPVTMLNGGLVYMMNNADAYQQDPDGLIHWIPLSVLYCDRTGKTDEVFRYEATAGRDGCAIVAAEIHGLVRLERNAMSISVPSTSTRPAIRPT